MSTNDFTGMRKVTIKDTATGGTGEFVVMNPDKVGADGFTIALEANEVTESSMAGDRVSPTGTNTSAATLSLIPRSIDDLAAIWPQGYDATTGTWQPTLGKCVLSDVTLAYEKVCDSKGNVILRHAEISLAFELALARDDSFTAEVMVYPSWSLGSEYGLAGDLASDMIPYQVYDGVYDASTDLIDFDAVGS